MRRDVYAISLVLAWAQLSGCASQPAAHPETEWPPSDAQRKFPPLVFSSEAYLQCSISSTQEGRQVMTTTLGQGFSFEAVMRPITKSELQLKGAGMRYKFDAFPSKAFPARFAGLGEGVVTEMKAEVEVEVKRFQQQGGSGTEISFGAEDIDQNAAYVEFTGVWVRNDKKRFPFRVLFGRVQGGEGHVRPTDDQPSSHIMSKAVNLGTIARPATVTTSLYEEESDVVTLPQ
jgi:hypothetical protein